EVENCKVSIRNIRRDSNEGLKKLNKDGLSDDKLRNAEERVQSITNDKTAKAESIFSIKEKDILTV
ncbi:ribosome recycling factor, partial [Flavobacteriales bacterium]|nr:ribosome recycling factor [Flavobacteriales bacterium]